MDWLRDLYESNQTARAIGLITLVCAVGMMLGSIKVRGIGVGTAAVLFAGILAGHFTRPIDHETLEFVKEFGLVLFVFCIGLQLGPGFFASLRRMGLRLNALAAAIVLMGALVAAGIGYVLKIDPAAVLGLFSGASTNTPSLGAAQQTLSGLDDVSEERAALPALAYAVTYPGAIVGIIATILILKRVFRVDHRRELEALASEQRERALPLERRTLVVDNPNLEGVAIASIPGLTETGVVVSRIKRVGAEEVQSAVATSQLHRGDRILAVGSRGNLDQFQRIVGSTSNEDLMEAPGLVTTRRVIVTRKAVLGKMIGQIRLDELLSVTATRVTRGDLEMTAVPNFQLQFGDVVQVVGSEEGVKQAADVLGNSLKALSETHFVPLFAGVVAGILLGTWPIEVPGLPQPVQLGLAGGPLIVALVVSRVGRIGPLVWHMPYNANLAFRELGISLFFAGVGLLAGPEFFATVLTAQGLLWVGAGLCITMVPLLAAGIFAMKVGKMSFVDVSGLLAGSMTDPPSLAFASNICGTDAPSVAYATVYPLTTMLRILAAQILVVVLCT